MKGWVKDYRIDETHWLHPLHEERAFTKYEAWKDLIKMVNHKDNKFMFGIELIIVERGKKITSLRQLCERWKWSKSKVDSFLNLLQKDGMILLQTKQGKRTLLEIVNYEKWQGKEESNEDEIDEKKDSDETVAGQLQDSCRTATDYKQECKECKE